MRLLETKKKCLQSALLLLTVAGITAVSAQGAGRSPFSHRSPRSDSAGQTGSVSKPSEPAKNEHRYSTGPAPTQVSGHKRDEVSAPSRLPPPQTRPTYGTGETRIRSCRPEEPPSSHEPHDSRDYNRNDRHRGGTFERNGERSSRSYKPDDDSFHHKGYYRPYKGWSAPHHFSGYFYYSWPHRTEPCHFGFYVWDYDPACSYRSVYFHYGYCPYIYRDRIVIVDRPVIAYTETPMYIGNHSDDYYLSQARVDELALAIDDIRKAWTQNRPELIEWHVKSNERIAVFLDGSYSYSVTGSDYMDMTLDTMDRIRTTAFQFNRIVRRNNGQITLFGVHSYLGAEDDIKTTYVSYTLDRLADEWIITEVGSSDRPLR